MGSPSTDAHPGACACGVCGADVPPLVGSVLTGTGLTLAQAAATLARGAALPAMTDVQRRMVERYAEDRAIESPAS